jgi:hypothetical protein
LEDRRKEELFSKKVKAGRRTYYFDVKENVNSDKYLIISETKTVDFGKQDRFRIMVFPEDIDNFQDAFSEVVTFIKNNNFVQSRRTEDEEGESNNE